MNINFELAVLLTTIRKNSYSESLWATVVGLVFLCGNSVYGESMGSADPCKADDTIRIQRPFYPDRSSSSFGADTFQYAFRFIKGRNPKLPTIIFIPGGPGAYSIPLSEFRELLYGIPTDYNAVLTDPRGRGCNEDLGQNVSSDIFSTAYLASDILALIKHLNLRNYILFGHSYGTLLSTEVAFRAEQGEAMFAPLAVVLEGTVGHALDRPYEGFISHWNRTRANLPKEVLSQFAGSLPFGISPDGWGKYIVSALTAGTDPDGHNLGTKLLALASGKPSEVASLREDVLSAANKQESTSMNRIYFPIWCRELALTDNIDMALLDGNLVGGRNPSACLNFHLDHPYDSRAWQILAPIFYLQGENDPATTVSQARYHFLNQRRSKRFFIEVAEGGHSPVPNLADCRDEIWNSIAHRGINLRESLKACNWPTTLEVKVENQ